MAQVNFTEECSPLQIEFYQIVVLEDGTELSTTLDPNLFDSGQEGTTAGDEGELIQDPAQIKEFTVLFQNEDRESEGNYNLFYRIYQYAYPENYVESETFGVFIRDRCNYPGLSRPIWCPEELIEEVRVQKPRWIVALQDQSVRVGETLEYKMGPARSSTGEKMSVILNTADPNASKFIKVDTSQNVLYVVTERIGVRQIGRYEVAVIANYYDTLA